MVARSGETRDESAPLRLAAATARAACARFDARGPRVPEASARPGDLTPGRRTLIGACYAGRVRWAHCLLAVAPLFPLACGSFGASEDPPANDASAPEAGDGGPNVDVGTIDDAASSTETRTPPVCPILKCTDDVSNDDCTDDGCEGVGNDFTGHGTAQRVGGNCAVPDGTGYFQSERPRTQTPSRFVELAFDLVAASLVANARITELAVDDSSSPRVTLNLESGRLRLCAVTAGSTVCSSSSVGVPIGKRVHLYGTINLSATTPQAFGVSIDCQEVLRLDVTAPFGPGVDILGTVGCLDQTCNLAFDKVTLLTRP